MASDHLRRDPLDHLSDSEPRFFGCDLAVKHYLKQQVSKLAYELLVVALIYSFHDFISFFEEHWLEAFVSLLTIPWAAAGRAQPGDQLDEPGEFFASAFWGLLGHVGNLLDEAAKRQDEIEE